MLPVFVSSYRTKKTPSNLQLTSLRTCRSSFSLPASASKLGSTGILCPFHVLLRCMSSVSRPEGPPRLGRRPCVRHGLSCVLCSHVGNQDHSNKPCKQFALKRRESSTSEVLFSFVTPDLKWTKTLLPSGSMFQVAPLIQSLWSSS